MPTTSTGRTPSAPRLAAPTWTAKTPTRPSSPAPATPRAWRSAPAERLTHLQGGGGLHGSPPPTPLPPPPRSRRPPASSPASLQRSLAFCNASGFGRVALDRGRREEEDRRLSGG